VRNVISLSIVCVTQLLILPAYCKMLPEEYGPKSENNNAGGFYLEGSGYSDYVSALNGAAIAFNYVRST